MDVQPVELEDAHVQLVPMCEAHIDDLFEIGQYTQIWSYLSMRVESHADMELLVHNALVAQEKGTELPFVIIEQQSKKILGSTRLLDISAANRSVEIGWTWITPRVWRTPVNTACKFLLLQHCFDTQGMIRVQLKTDTRNVRSQQAIERIGGVKEGILRNHRILYDGYVRDSVYYSIIKQEWPVIKQRLATFLCDASE